MGVAQLLAMPTVPFPSMQCPNSNSRHDFRYDEHLLLGQLTKPNLHTKTETGQAKRTAKKVHQAKVHQAILTPKCAANARSSILAILICKNSIPIPFANPHPPQSISPLPSNKSPSPSTSQPLNPTHLPLSFTPILPHLQALHIFNPNTTNPPTHSPSPTPHRPTPYPSPSLILYPLHLKPKPKPNPNPLP